METVTVNVKRVGEHPADEPANWATTGPADLDADLERARRLARWLDSKFEVMGVRFGADAILGLIPVVGDTLTALTSAYLIYIARRHNLGSVVQTRMAFNILLDWLPGLIPVVGDLWDVAYKANLKNLELLEKAAERKRRHTTRTAP